MCAKNGGCIFAYAKVTHDRHLTNPLTFRISNLPRSITSSQFRDILRELVGESGTVGDNAGLLRWSFAPTPTLVHSERSFVATATFRAALAPDRLKSAILRRIKDSSSSPIVGLNFFGLNSLSYPPQPTIDVIAVTGLAGHAFGSWKSRSEPEMWLRDYLPMTLPEARIMTYGYDTKLPGSQSNASIFELSRKFLESIKTVRDHEETDRPLIFIGHSLGGLVIKQALVYAAEGSLDDVAVFKSCYALLFFGVPNRSLEVSSLTSMVEVQPNEELVRNLGGSSRFLGQVHEEFYRHFTFEDSHIISIYETKKTPTVVLSPKTGAWERTGPSIMMVPRSSAIHAGKNEKTHDQLSIDANHSDIVKFSDRCDSDYSIIEPRLQRLASDAPEIIRERFAGHRKVPPKRTTRPTQKKLLAVSTNKKARGAALKAKATSARRMPAKPIQVANEEVDIEEIDLTGDLSGGQDDLNSSQPRMSFAEPSRRLASHDIKVVEQQQPAEEEDDDFPILPSCYLYINGRYISQRQLQKTTRFLFSTEFELVEEKLDLLVSYALDDGSLQPEYKIARRVVTVRTSTGRGSVSHDMTDFSLSEFDMVFHMIDMKHKDFPKSSIAIRFKFKLTCELPPKKKKDILPLDSSPLATPTMPQRFRTGKLLEQQQVRLDSLKDVGSQQVNILTQWICTHENCTNFGNLCFIDDDREHYAIGSKHCEAWANSVARGETTVMNPPIKMLKKDGAIGKNYRRTEKTTQAKQLTSRMDSLMQMLRQQQEFAMQDKALEIMDRMAERQERREREQQRQQQPYSGGLQPVTYQYRPLPPAYPYASPYPAYTPPPPPPPSLQHYHAPGYSSQLGSSSPAYPEEDAETIERFFEWKIGTITHAGSLERRRHTGQVCINQMWTIDFLRQMCDRNSEAYGTALGLGLSDGIITRFQKEVHNFKDPYRRQKAAE